uniref:Uncharacterized protein n=1 Tax=Zea mays TaxID=4577 RepID=A0A804NSZ9_MAIZE
MAAASLSRGGCRRHLTLGARHLPSRHLPHGAKPMAFLVLASPNRSYLQRWLPSPPRGVFSVAAPCVIPLAGVLDYSAMEVATPSFPHLPPSVLSSAPLLPAPCSCPSHGCRPLPQLTPSSCHGARPCPSPVASVSPYLCWRLASHLPCVGRPPLGSHRWHLSLLQLVLMAMPLFPRVQMVLGGVVYTAVPFYKRVLMVEDENNLVRGAEHAAITRITYETAVSGSILTLVYGDNGSNLAKLREVLLCNYLT